MADYLTTDTELKSIADAIRTKGGTSETLSFPDGFVTAIEGIETGGGTSDAGFTATVTPAENTLKLSVPYDQTPTYYCLTVYCADISGAGDVKRIKQQIRIYLPLYSTVRMDVVEADGSADYWSTMAASFTGTALEITNGRSYYYEAGKTYSVQIMVVNV